MQVSWSCPSTSRPPGWPKPTLVVYAESDKKATTIPSSLFFPFLLTKRGNASLSQHGSSRLVPKSQRSQKKKGRSCSYHLEIWNRGRRPVMCPILPWKVTVVFLCFNRTGCDDFWSFGTKDAAPCEADGLGTMELLLSLPCTLMNYLRFVYWLAITTAHESDLTNYLLLFRPTVLPSSPFRSFTRERLPRRNVSNQWQQLWYHTVFLKKE
jgi:hypothetical protein